MTGSCRFNLAFLISGVDVRVGLLLINHQSRPCIRACIVTAAGLEMTTNTNMKTVILLWRYLPGSFVCFLIALVWLMAAGCASPNVDPPTPRAHTGYVDFFADDENLYWQVDQVEADGKTQQLFSLFAPLNEHILRLAFAPGHYRFRVTFMNHAIRKPGALEVEVQDEMITPVQVTLVDVGEALVQSKSVQGGATYFGHYGRNTRITDNPNIMYQVNLMVGPFSTYKPKAAMPYDKPSDE
jgi:hypothetical protein